MLPLVVKKDDRREPFDRAKIMNGLTRACEKRPISADALEKVVAGIEARLQEEGRKEVPSREIGEAVMGALRSLDPVAYVRFASVYREFRDVEEFMRELRGFLQKGPP
jgi:transcriptional repressor NrdR